MLLSGYPSVGIVAKKVLWKPPISWRAVSRKILREHDGDLDR
jgi:hypothetical protein